MVLAATLAAPAPAVAQVDRGVVTVVEVNGLIDPVIVDFVGDALDAAEDAGAEALVLQLDSHGSAVADEQLEALVERIADGPVPVAVWVGPSGAEAVGDAALLVAAAGVAGMAPNTELGEAPPPEVGELPVALRTGTVGPDRALELGVVDMTEEEAAVIGTFIASLDGREVAGGTLETAEFEEVADGPPEATLTVQTRLVELGLVPQLFHTVASPAVAYLLLVAGLGLVVFEFFTAGVGIAAAVAAVSLVLASYGLAVLPVSLVALALILVGVLGFAVDVQSGVPRFWTVVGGIAFVVGSLLLFDGVPRPWLALAVGGSLFVVSMLAGMPAMVRSRFSTPTIGRESMIGEMGEAAGDVRPDGVVRVREALWPAHTNRATPITAGASVRVVGIDGLVLEVEPEEGGARDYRR